MNYNKQIWEGKYGKRKFVDGLSENTAYENHASKTTKALDEVFKTREISYDRPFELDAVDKAYENEVGK